MILGRVLDITLSVSLCLSFSTQDALPLLCEPQRSKDWKERSRPQGMRVPLRVVYNYLESFSVRIATVFYFKSRVKKKEKDTGESSYTTSLLLKWPHKVTRGKEGRLLP